MGNYSKLIGSVVGGVIGLGVSVGVLPEGMQDPKMVSSITTILAGIGTYFFPKNMI